MTGRIEDRELFSMLATADVCVNPDRASALNDLSTMNKIVEYMAFAKPIVQFDLREGRVSAQNASLYARPDDVQDLAQKILELLDDPERRRSMGDAGRRRVESELAWSHQEKSLLAAYERLFQN
jgi:glycosyltransferase involved in cell wall biosynthesis